jgi:hypothetical protein
LFSRILFFTVPRKISAWGSTEAICTAWAAHIILVGYSMKHTKSFLFATLATAMLLSACQDFKHGTVGGGGGGGTGGGGGGTTTANVSFVLVADTPPANLGLVSLKVVPTSITLTPSTGTATTFNINSGNGYSYDLVRLQSDSAFLGTVPSVPAGTYTSIAVTFSGAEIAFFNGTGAAITNLTPSCAAGAVCIVTFPGPFTSTITSSVAIGANTGLGIDVNLANAASVTGSALTISFTNSTTTSVVSAFALPRTNSNLASGQLDIIEDFTGIATVSGSTVTIAPAPTVNHPAITASTVSTTVYDIDPTGLLCSGATSLSGCFTTTGEAASMDAILNSDGTFTVQEIEPLLASPAVDTVEGTVISISQNITTQFAITVTDIIPAASNSLITSVGIGAPLTVNLGTGASFRVDTKGLAVGANNTSNFTSGSDTTALRLGQSVAVHVNAFTAASGTTAAIANNVDTVTLRWSRFTATAVGSLSPSLININTLPPYFSFNPTSSFEVQIFSGIQGQGTDVTNLDGIQDGNPPQAAPLGIRALFIEDPGNSLAPAFFAAKVRQQ